MTISRCICAVFLFILMFSFSYADVNTINYWDFETGIANWTSADQQGSVNQEIDPELAFSGDAALRFDFLDRALKPDMNDGIPGTMYTALETPPVNLKSVKLQIASSYSAPMAVGLIEADGSIYNSIIWCEAGKWNEIALSLTDFAPVVEMELDENDKLDLEEIDKITISCANMMLRVLAQEGNWLYSPPEAPMQIWLDNVELSSEELTQEPVFEGFAEATMLLLDSCRIPTVRWLIAGAEEATITVEPEDMPDKEYLQIKYTVPAGKIYICYKNIPIGLLKDYMTLRMDIASDIPAMLSIGAEEADGSRFMSPVNLPGNSEWTTIEAPFAFFSTDGQSNVGDRQLQPENIIRLGIADIMGIGQNVMSANTWRIRNMRVTKE